MYYTIDSGVMATCISGYNTVKVLWVRGNSCHRATGSGTAVSWRLPVKRYRLSCWRRCINMLDAGLLDCGIRIADCRLYWMVETDTWPMITENRLSADGLRQTEKSIKLSNYGKGLNDGCEFNEIPAIFRLWSDINNHWLASVFCPLSSVFCLLSSGCWISGNDLIKNPTRGWHRVGLGRRKIW